MFSLLSPEEISHIQGGRNDGEGFPDTFLPVNEQRVGFDLEVVLQPGLVLEEILHTDLNDIETFQLSVPGEISYTKFSLQKDCTQLL